MTVLDLLKVKYYKNQGISTFYIDICLDMWYNDSIIYYRLIKNYENNHLIKTHGEYFSFVWGFKRKPKDIEYNKFLEKKL